MLSHNFNRWSHKLKLCSKIQEIEEKLIKNLKFCDAQLVICFNKSLISLGGSTSGKSENYQLIPHGEHRVCHSLANYHIGGGTSN